VVKLDSDTGSVFGASESNFTVLVSSLCDCQFFDCFEVLGVTGYSVSESKSLPSPCIASMASMFLLRASGCNNLLCLRSHLFTPQLYLLLQSLAK